MHGLVIQDWITIRGAPAVGSIAQSERSWPRLDGYQDIIFWLQVAEITTSGASVTMNYETAPLKDESLFVGMGSQGITSAAMSPPLLTKVIVSALPPQNLGLWVRWRLGQSGAVATWDVTFRILAAANPVSVYARASSLGAM